VIEGVRTFRLSEGVVYIIEDVERVHVVEPGRVLFVEDFLLEGVEIFPVVDNDLSIRSADEPLIIWFQIRDVE